MSNSGSVSSGYPKRGRGLKITTRNGVFLTTFEIKHSLECLIYFINGNKNLGVNGEAKVISSKSILVKSENPSLLHGYDCFLF